MPKSGVIACFSKILGLEGGGGYFTPSPNNLAYLKKLNYNRVKGHLMQYQRKKGHFPSILVHFNIFGTLL